MANSTSKMAITTPIPPMTAIFPFTKSCRATFIPVRQRKVSGKELNTNLFQGFKQRPDDAVDLTLARSSKDSSFALRWAL